MKNRLKTILAATTLVTALSGCGLNGGKPSIEALEKGFKNIPDSVQTAVYWYWISDNISKEGVVKDLEAMKKVGINRAFLGSMGIDGVPYGNVKFQSPEWWDITHAALKRATELGIEIGIFNSPGWSQSGGPWVKPEQAMRYLTSAQITVKGNGSKQDIVLPEWEKDAQPVKVLAYPLVPQKEYEWTISKKNGQPVEKQLNLALPRGVDMRSLIVTVGNPFRSNAEIFAKEGGEYKLLRKFEIDRSNPALNVGFTPYAPVVISLPETKATEFKFTLDGGGEGEVKVVLSANPWVERYAEKSLAKMYQTPLPMWHEYMWEVQPECSDSTLVIQPDKMIDVTPYLEGNVLKQWQVPDGEWTVLCTSMIPTGVTNSPAVPEATGLEIDKMSRKHVEAHFDAYIGEILRKIPAEDRKSFRVVVQDSYETGGLNWTDDMEEVFKSRYGYSPVPYLPTLFGQVVGSRDQSDRFLWDLRRLIADRVAYDYVAGLRDICHKHGLQTWLENYGHWGFPGEFLMYGGQSDQISGEFWSEGNLGDIENRAASSCGHIYGKRQIWAESCTSGGPVFYRYPRMMKQRVDRFFTEGINSTLLHLYIQQPDDRMPGMAAWFGNEFNRNNTWFEYMDLFTQYLKRCNFMLQQGRYIADVAYFIGEDAPKMTGVCDPALPYGYSFDYINAEVLMDKAKVVNGKLVLDSGMEYHVLVLPKQKTMRPELLAKIKTLVNEGLVVLGPAPERSPSLMAYPEADGAVQLMAEELWNGNKNYVGKGRVYSEAYSLQQVFDDLKLRPDFSLDGEEQQEKATMFIHRTLNDEGELYFISNQTDAESRITPTFRVKNLKPELWNPVNGEIHSLPYTEKDSLISVPLTLQPLESVFVVFRHTVPTGRKQVYSVDEAQSMPLNNDWQVHFLQRGKTETEFTVAFDSLYDWASATDERIKYFSGTATYTKNVTIEKTNTQAYILDLGQAMVMAKVKVNGKYAGGVWTSPYRIDVTDYVKDGENTLEVMVVNNWMNRLIGDARLPEQDRITWTNVQSWNADSHLQPSGLIGPVRLLTVNR